MRSERYRELLPIERLSQIACSIIGVGAIGRQVALQLAAMGVGRVQLVDPEVVESVNLGPQGYLEDDVGRPKVQATADLMQQINHGLKMQEEQQRFARSMDIHPVVFACVDSISMRRHIWNEVNKDADLFIDGRMAAEVLRVVTVSNSVAAIEYPDTLFAEHEALRQACTAQSTIYCANVAAGFMVSQFTKWLRNMPTEFDVTVNLLAAELTAT